MKRLINAPNFSRVDIMFPLSMNGGKSTIINYKSQMNLYTI